MTSRKLVQYVLLVAISSVLAGCAALQPPSATGPKGTEQIYPLLYTADDARRNATTAAISRLIQPVNTDPQPVLQPVTATIADLGANPGHPVYLSKLGTAAVMTEEETRESLRRFITDWQDLIGADPTKLSLVERVDQPDGAKLATYEQRPFRYPIRGPFGRLQIRFTPDRRVLSVSSTCIPDADRIQATLNGTAVKLKSEDVINTLVNGPIDYFGPAGVQQHLTVQASQLTPRELVTYIRVAKDNPNSLEFHTAWETEVSDAPVKKVYVDAINSEIIAAE